MNTPYPSLRKPRYSLFPKIVRVYLQNIARGFYFGFELFIVEKTFLITGTSNKEEEYGMIYEEVEREEVYSLRMEHG